MKSVFVFCIFLWLSCTGSALSAQSRLYDASLIPPALKAHARAVVRDEEVEVNMKNPGEVWVTHKKVITILNAGGKGLGALELNYDKSRSVQSLSGAMYDARGAELRKFKKNDFEDVSTIEDFSLFEDERAKRIYPVSSDFPYTVVYDYTVKYKFSLFLPKWFPVEADGISVERSSFRVTVPADDPLRYHGVHTGDPLVDSSDRRRISYLWKMEAVPAFGDEQYMPPIFQSDVPVLIVSPERFEYYGMIGSCQNWSQFGSWVYQHLLKGRDRLPAATIAKIHEMTDGYASAEQKARKIYEYVQQKNRYVSIQVGKGGLVPMDASAVDQVSYGDCKALVNYTMALLKIAGIPSYYTEVYAGDDDMSLIPGFASGGQGDHVILCVPFGKDTTWLECTNKYMPFGFLGSFTDNRNVLVCAPGGGILTRTPGYPCAGNLQTRSADFTLDSAGDLRGNMRTTFSGLSYQKRAGFEHLSPGDRTKQIKSVYGYLQMDISDLGLSYEKAAIPSAAEHIAFTSRAYGAPNQDGFSVPLNPVDRFDDIPRMVSRRVNEVFIARGYETTDSLNYVLPRGASLSLVPKEIHLHTRFGNYDTRLLPGEGQLTYVRKFTLTGGTYPPDSYPDFVAFLKHVSGYDRESFIIRTSQVVTR